jgi:hypothetical protein
VVDKSVIQLGKKTDKGLVRVSAPEPQQRGFSPSYAEAEE